MRENEYIPMIVITPIYHLISLGCIVTLILCFTDSELLNIAVASLKYCEEISITFEVGT